MQKIIIPGISAILILTVFFSAAGATGVPFMNGWTLNPNGIGSGSDQILKENAPLESVLMNNETIYTASGNQIIQEATYPNLDTRPGFINAHWGYYYQFTIRNKTSVWLNTPFVTSHRKTGKTVYARYVWMTLNMPVGTNITSISVNTRDTTLYKSNRIRPGTGVKKTYLIDMGSLKAIPFGLQTVATISNGNMVNSTVNAYGAEVLQEWN